VLYRPEAFEPLTDRPWDERRVRNAIDSIVTDADDALRGPKLLWRAHEWEGWHSTSRFAVHALGQVERRPGRYSLWIGNVGVALYAADCLDARGRYPVLESWTS
jgi:hypothetical protein